jgi:hypothetical protein
LDVRPPRKTRFEQPRKLANKRVFSAMCRLRDY